LGYIILCINLNKSSFSKFELEIQSNKKIININSLSDFLNIKRKHFEIFCKWERSNSGGGPQEKTFYKNMKYEIVSSKSQEATIELISHENYQISIMLVEAGNNDISCDNFHLRKDKFTTIIYQLDLFHTKIHLEANKKYFMVPFTKEPNLFGHYDIRISTDEEIFVREHFCSKNK
jgi:hypothetical protein